MPLGLSAKEQKRLNSMTAVVVPLLFPGPVKAALEQPIDGAEAMCLLFAGAAGGTLSRVTCILSLRPRGFNRDEATTIAHEGMDGLIAKKLAKIDGEDAIALTAKGLKIYEKINSNLDALKPVRTKK